MFRTLIEDFRSTHQTLDGRLTSYVTRTACEKRSCQKATMKTRVVIAYNATRKTIKLAEIVNEDWPDGRQYSDVTAP